MSLLKTQQPPAAHQQQQRRLQDWRQQELLQGPMSLTSLMWVQVQLASWQPWQPWQEHPHLKQATRN